MTNKRITIRIPKIKSPGRSGARVVPNALEVHTTRAAFLFIGLDLVAVQVHKGPAVLPFKWCTGVRSVDFVSAFLVQYGHKVSEGKAAIDQAIESGTILVKNARPGGRLTVETTGDMAKSKNKEQK